MTAQLRKRKMLFVSSMAASRSNAIGMQVLQLAKGFDPDWSHCYWDYDLGMSEVRNSYCLNNSIPYRVPFEVGRNFLSREIERLGLGWWRGDRLIDSKRQRLREFFADAGFAHVAPLHTHEATRFREILEAVRCPFVVHIWDLFETTPNNDYKWLLTNAERVFCLSEAMVTAIRAMVPCDTSILRFVRSSSKYRARYISGNTLKIGLIGFLHAYRDGLELLSRAVESLRVQFTDIRLKYIGAPEQFKYIPAGLRELTEYVGAVDDDDRDRALAECNVGYLPGPLPSPEQDPRSRYSIPSRSGDYMAVGLPVIAATDLFSATSTFFSSIRERGFFPIRHPQHLCFAVEKLRDEDIWMQAAHECSHFFETHLNRERALIPLHRIASHFLCNELW